jgi:hypothetical protein
MRRKHEKRVLKRATTPPPKFCELEWFAAIAWDYQKAEDRPGPGQRHRAVVRKELFQKENTPMQTLGPEKVCEVVG